MICFNFCLPSFHPTYQGTAPQRFSVPQTRGQLNTDSLSHISWDNSTEILCPTYQGTTQLRFSVPHTRGHHNRDSLSHIPGDNTTQILCPTYQRASQQRFSVLCQYSPSSVSQPASAFKVGYEASCKMILFLPSPTTFL